MTEHEHEHAEVEDAFVPDPGVQAYVTTITLSIAHPGGVSPTQVVADVKATLDEHQFSGVVAGVSSVELRGDGGLIGL